MNYTYRYKYNQRYNSNARLSEVKKVARSLQFKCAEGNIFPFKPCTFSHTIQLTELTAKNI